VTWLLRLYPRVWRQRYAGEVAEMLAGRGFSLRIAVDLIAGAIDARLHPSETLAAAVAAAQTAPEERTMLSKVLRFDCSALYGASVSKADQWKAGMSTVAWTAVLTLAWMGLHVRLHDDPRVDSLSMMPFMFSMIYSMRYTYLKERPGSVQAIFIGGTTLVIGLFLLAVGWIAAQI
jgi:hypothetical protein